jgi:transcription termination/antitermination protein NusA
MCAGPDLIRIVDLMHRDKNIPKEVIFEGIEAALQLATQKHYGTEEEIAITIDRDSGEIKAQKGGAGDRPGRAGPHRRPERQAGHDPENPRGRVQRHLRRVRHHERGPRARDGVALRGGRRHGDPGQVRGHPAEQIPGEAHHVGERVKAVILEVRKAGTSTTARSSAFPDGNRCPENAPFAPGRLLLGAACPSRPPREGH